MNESERRRLLLIGLPAALLLAGAVLTVFLWLDDAESAGTITGPRITDHWHARYEYWVCGEPQPNAPEWSSGIHTHGDGLIHIHPFQESEEGRGARLVKWFEYGGGVLTQDEVRLPGDQSTYSNGDECPDGSTGVVQVFVATVAGEEAKLDEWSEYIPQDGDYVLIAFGPEE
jgi:hypothetical protein